jgi:hypothetical protein
MGAIARNIANNITTSGVFTSSAITNSSVTGITVLANASDGITFISSQTASNSASISFTSGLDSTYKAYKFVFVNIRPATDNVYFTFQTSTNAGSSYGVTCTSDCFKAFRSEASGTTAGVNYELQYRADADLAQSTSFQRLHGDGGTGNDADQNVSGYINLFNPSSTTYVKHFIAVSNNTTSADYSINSFFGGYFNTTSAINAIQFKMESGNIADGKIYLYGIK